MVDGANRDDGADYRPGMRAAAALGVRSPLAEAGIGKAEVREWARRLGLPNWDLPASPCLASRFPYGEPLTTAKLQVVAEAEGFLGSKDSPRSGYGTMVTPPASRCPTRRSLGWRMSP